MSDKLSAIHPGTFSRDDDGALACGIIIRVEDSPGHNLSPADLDRVADRVLTLREKEAAE
ncbi:MAG: hypothetical protein ACOC8P_00485 [Dichotomicrobium sp.]